VIPEPPLDAPDEEWLVWGDAMQQIGDPRGELIALANTPQFAPYVKHHADALFGREVGRYVRKNTMRVTWNRARVDVMEVRIDEAANGPQMFADLIQSPIAPQMRGLAIVGVPPAQTGRDEKVLDLTTTLGWFREMDLPKNWTSLSLIDDRARDAKYMITRDFQPEPNIVVFGPLPTLWPALAHLEELRVVVADPAQIQFGTIRLPELRAFALDCLYWTDGTGALLAQAEWPKLSSIALRFVEDFTINNPDDRHAYRPVYRWEHDERDDPFASRARDYVDRGDDLRALFEALQRLPLQRLALTSFNDASLVLDMLEQHELPHLRELDLSDGALDANAAERLGNNPLLLQLQRLVLERVAAPTAAAFVGLAATVVHSHATNPPTYRYVVGWE
jgi:hypothetical protein